MDTTCGDKPLQTTPYALYGWKALQKMAGKRARGADGSERRTKISLFDVISVSDAILVAVALVNNSGGEDNHAVVWDGWRSVLFVGPGKFCDRQLDGALLVGDADKLNENHVDPYYGVTITQYVRDTFGLQHFNDVHVLMANTARLAETEHL